MRRLLLDRVERLRKIGRCEQAPAALCCNDAEEFAACRRRARSQRSFEAEIGQRVFVHAQLADGDPPVDLLAGVAGCEIVPDVE
jgi:hypothetical protein